MWVADFRNTSTTLRRRAARHHVTRSTTCPLYAPLHALLRRAVNPPWEARASRCSRRWRTSVGHAWQTAWGRRRTSSRRPTGSRLPDAADHGERRRSPSRRGRPARRASWFRSSVTTRRSAQVRRMGAPGKGWPGCQGPRCVQRPRRLEELGDLNSRAPMDGWRRRGCAPVCYRDPGGEHGDAFLRHHERLAGRSGLPHARKARPVTPWHSWLRGDEEKITYQDTVMQPPHQRHPTSPGEIRAPSTVVAATALGVQNVECRKPWHAHGSPAVLRRPRLDDGHGRVPADLPSAARLARITVTPRRRPPSRSAGSGRGRGALPDDPQQKLGHPTPQY